MAIQYTQSEGVSLGYTVTGNGNQTTIYIPGAYSNLAIERYYPESVEWGDFLASFGRMVTFDKRATGVSDRSARPLNLDQQIVDIEAIRNATESEDIIVCGLSQGAPLAILYALAYPEKVKAIILVEGVCCDATDPYASLSDTNTLFDWDRSIKAIDSDFAKWCLEFAEMMLPGSTQEDLDRSVEYMQATASPASHKFIWCCLMGFDLRPMLRHVDKPTLVIHGKNDQLYPVKHGRYFSEHIPEAEYVELPSACHIPFYDPEAVPILFNSIKSFILNLPESYKLNPSTRFVTTVVFTDIVGSTEKQRLLGDLAWADVVGTFEKNSTAIVEQCRGKIIRFTGDGIKAAFEVPGDALRASELLAEDANKLACPVRVGLHTGEVQWQDDDLHGMAVNIAARVAQYADAGEVLTTTVTQGIVEGGDYAFAIWGEADLKGIGTRTLVRLVQK